MGAPGLEFRHQRMDENLTITRQNKHILKGGKTQNWTAKLHNLSIIDKVGVQNRTSLPVKIM